jgi:hypothetical protein
VLSESGEFILGPYAHEFDNTDGYVQQYNERGHPEFRASRVAARELRRAKNDVLSTVGVLYKTTNTNRSKKNERELVKLVKSENEAGFFLSSIDNLAMFCSLWWLFSLRMRVQVSARKAMIPPDLVLTKIGLRELLYPTYPDHQIRATPVRVEGIPLRWSSGMPDFGNTK